MIICSHKYQNSRFGFRFRWYIYLFFFNEEKLIGVLVNLKKKPGEILNKFKV